ncbi:MAG: fibronectin type III domain-containing protein, partial [Chloroflexi bacterium]|nr:fibronectin type III domain-containing protein [Chloroflexota bacterium]
MKGFVVVAALVGLLMSISISSCATGNKVTIQPLSSVPKGIDGPHVKDIGPHSARIVFTSGVHVVCNVAYGADDRYGKLAVMAMAGPTTDHELQLLGLEPNTTYHFRATVTDLAGNVYRSDDNTFTTTMGDLTAKPAGRNVAAASEGARIVGVS